MDEGEKAIPGFSLAECVEILGNTVEGIVRWKRGSDLARWANRPVRLRIRMRDAHLYAFRFL